MTQVERKESEVEDAAVARGIDASDLPESGACGNCGATDAVNLGKRTAAIATANDAFGTATIGGGHDDYLGQMVCAEGAAGGGLAFLARAQLDVAGFGRFTNDNDPYGDHSFGAVSKKKSIMADAARFPLPRSRIWR